MRLNQIVAGEEYATCDGALVVPESPVERGFFTVDRSKSPEPVWNTEGALDPWGGYMKASRPADIGIRVRRYKADRDGRRIKGDKGYLFCIAPRDIKGSWTEFLVLYGERVRQAADDRTAEQKARALMVEVNSAVGRYNDFQRAQWLCVLNWHWSSKQHLRDRHLRKISIHLEMTPDQFAAFMRKLGKPLPRGLAKRLRDAYLTAQEFGKLQ